MSSVDVVRKIEAVLQRDPRVAVAYLFGSVARDQAGPRSDVDVAVLLTGDARARAEARGELLDELVRALRTDDVDLVDLREASIPLRYRVVREGRRLHTADEAARQRFETDTAMRYLDFEPLRERAFLVAREAIVGDR